MICTWTPEPNTANYISEGETALGEPTLRATFKHAYNGYACYWVHRADTPMRQRTLKNALSVGGLPTNVNV